MAFIYCLKDPDDLRIRYIGKTVHRESYRMGTHYRDKRNVEKYEWLAALKKIGKKPIFEILEECNEKNWEEREVYHIGKAIKDGEILFNKTSGGLNRKDKKKYRIAVSLDTHTIEKAKKIASSRGFFSVGSYIRGLVIKDITNTKVL